MSGGYNGNMAYWVMGNDGPHSTITGAHNYSINALLWHPLGHCVASAANDGVCKFWCREPPGSTLEEEREEWQEPSTVVTGYGPLPPPAVTHSSSGGGRHDGRHDHKHDNRHDHRHDNKHDNRHDSRNDSRHDSRHDHKYDNRHDNRNDSRNDGKRYDGGDLKRHGHQSSGESHYQRQPRQPFSPSQGQGQSPGLHSRQQFGSEGGAGGGATHSSPPAKNYNQSSAYSGSGDGSGTRKRSRFS